MTLKKHALVFSATLILFLGFSYLRYKEIKNNPSPESYSLNLEKKVLSESNDAKSTDEISPTDTPRIISEEVSLPSTTQTPQPVQQKIEIKNDVESDSNNNSASNPPINDFYYPGAGNIGSSTKTLNLESPDHPNKVTDWYKNKIQSFDLNVNSFVKSSADDKILNKLSAASGSFEVNVEISRNPGESITHIKVEIGN
ncbi:MAG TPA: hypothetical protein VI819_02110 [Patescibacteria group bacterium]|nr:hypothetical protein [Patescibacteria group bacterium]